MGVRQDLEEQYDFEIVDEFLDHFAMMVDIMEPLIVDLGDNKKYERTVEELFRIFHNVKSAAGYLKLEPLIRLATFVEDALDQMRIFDGPASDDTINWLLEVNDLFLTWQEDFKLDNELHKVKYELLKVPDLEA